MEGYVAHAECASVLEDGISGISEELQEKLRRFYLEYPKKYPIEWYGSDQPWTSMSVVALASEWKPKRYLEVGVQDGFTLIAMSILATEQPLRITGVDNWDEFKTAKGHDPSRFEGVDKVEQIRSAIQEFGGLQEDGKDPPKFQLISADTRSDQGKLHCKNFGGEPFDLVFMDHLKQDYVPHLKRLIDWGCVVPGSRVLFHDVDHHWSFGSERGIWGELVNFARESNLGTPVRLRDRLGSKGTDLVVPNLGLLEVA